jgi:hypothetical protein
MKKIIFTIIILGLFIPVTAVDSVLLEFSVNADGDHAVVTWQSGIEGNLTKYKLERSTDGQIFNYIYEQPAQGNFTEYEYIDTDLYKFTSQRVYYYRIKMIFADGSYTYSEVQSVTIILSGLMETWGSIKAMFR